MESKVIQEKAVPAVGSPDKEFLLAVFHEANEHMRNTEQKYLIMTAAYLGLASVITSNVVISVGATSRPTMISHFFLLLIGSMVYVMQGWYRSWKLHYLDVCQRVRAHLFDIVPDEGILPYWLRPNSKASRASIDNLMRSLTLIVSLGLSLLVAYELTIALGNIKGIVGVSVGVLFFGSYLLALLILDRMVHPSNILNA